MYVTRQQCFSCKGGCGILVSRHLKEELTCKINDFSLLVFALPGVRY